MININLKTIDKIGLLIILAYLNSCNYIDSKNTFTYEDILEISKTKNYKDFKVFIEKNKTNIENTNLKSERIDFDQKCSAYIKSTYEEHYEEKKNTRKLFTSMPKLFDNRIAKRYYQKNLSR